MKSSQLLVAVLCFWGAACFSVENLDPVPAVDVSIKHVTGTAGLADPICIGIVVKNNGAKDRFVALPAIGPFGISTVRLEIKCLGEAFQMIDNPYVYDGQSKDGIGLDKIRYMNLKPGESRQFNLVFSVNKKEAGRYALIFGKPLLYDIRIAILVGKDGATYSDSSDRAYALENSEWTLCKPITIDVREGGLDAVAIGELQLIEGFQNIYHPQNLVPDEDEGVIKSIADWVKTGDSQDRILRAQPINNHWEFLLAIKKKDWAGCNNAIGNNRIISEDVKNPMRFIADGLWQCERAFLEKSQKATNTTLPMAPIVTDGKIVIRKALDEAELKAVGDLLTELTNTATAPVSFANKFSPDAQFLGLRGREQIVASIEKSMKKWKAQGKDGPVFTHTYKEGWKTVGGDIEVVFTHTIRPSSSSQGESSTRNILLTHDTEGRLVITNYQKSLQAEK